MNKEEQQWLTAADNGDAASLRDLIAKKSTKPDASKAVEALSRASAKGHANVLRVLLEWGVSPDSKDQTGRPALHAACEAGAPASVAVLCEHGVNLNQLDSNGSTAFSLAIKNKQMPCCKELLRGGAALPQGELAAGLAAVLREVQLEKLNAELVAAAETPEVTSAEINAADPRVWECQREHMRLLRLRETQRAGKALANFDVRAAAELEAAQRSINEEAASQAALKEKKVELQALKGNIVMLNKEVNAETNEEMKLDAADAKLRAEIQQRMQELSAAESEVEASKSGFAGEEGRIAEAEGRWRRLEFEVAQQRQYNEMEVEELQAAQEEFERWKRDREAAFQLTAQAHKLLGN